MTFSITRASPDSGSWGSGLPRPASRSRAGGHFWKLLKEEEFEVSAGEVPMAKLAGRSTLELWSCLCQRARVGTESFAVRCLLCGAEFHPGDNVVKKAQSAKGARRRVAAKHAVVGAATRAAEPGADGLGSPPRRSAVARHAGAEVEEASAGPPRGPPDRRPHPQDQPNCLFCAGGHEPPPRGTPRAREVGSHRHVHW